VAACRWTPSELYGQNALQRRQKQKSKLSREGYVGLRDDVV
jgi:hypothetical protein